MDLRDSYDSAADAYAEHLAGELAHKPLDRHLLNRFAEATRGKGRVLDAGCGPGHVAAYLRDQGVEVFGLDLSPGMVACAARLNPNIEFRVGDVRALNLPSGSVAGLVAFYVIVHMVEDDLADLMREFRRVLAPGGLALISFHVGDERIHRDELFGATVNLDFYFHRVSAVTAAMTQAGLHAIETIEREPYPDAEYPSRRGYLLAVSFDDDLRSS